MILYKMFKRPDVGDLQISARYEKDQQTMKMVEYDINRLIEHDSL